MRHLFIINPVSTHMRGRTKEMINQLVTFFSDNKDVHWDYHVTRWSRDAEGYVRRYVNNQRDMVRVHSVGGSGTFFEVVNGVVGLPNAQVSFCPMGNENLFVRYFGDENFHKFQSLRNLVFSDTVPVDLIKCGNYYTATNASVGIFAVVRNKSENLVAKTRVSFLEKITMQIKVLLKPLPKYTYEIEVDGEFISGEFHGALFSNVPVYGVNFSPAVDVRHDSGTFDVHLLPRTKKFAILRRMGDFFKGNYRRYPEYVKYYSAKQLTVSSKDAMQYNVSGEVFFNTKIKLEIAPYSIDFVCPTSVDLQQELKKYDEMIRD